MSQISIKLALDDVTIKRTVDPETFGWDEFRAWALDRFPQARTVPNLKLTYEDEDGDQLCIVNGEDLKEAMVSQLRAGRPLRITLKRENSSSSDTLPPAGGSASSTAATTPVAVSLASSSASAIDADLERLAREVDLEEEAAAAAAAAGVTDVPPTPPRQQQQPLPRAAPYYQQVPPPPPGSRPPPPPVDEILHSVLDGLRRHPNVHRAIGRTRDHVLPIVGMFTPPVLAPSVTGIVGTAFDTAQRVVGGDPSQNYSTNAQQQQSQQQQQQQPVYATAYATATTTTTTTTSSMSDEDLKGGQQQQQQGNGVGGAREAADAASGAPHQHDHHHHDHHHHHAHHHARGFRGRHGRHHHPAPRGGFVPVDQPPPPEQQQPVPEATSSPSTTDGRVIHWNICCDKCGTQHIAGIRYKDSVRRNYDLCETCEATDESPFPYLKIRDPSKAPQAIVTVLPPEQDINYSNDESRIHLGVTCDGCGANPIIGDRYRCTRRANYDLCAECEEKDTTGYPMLKICRPSQAPAHLQVTGPTGKTCRWMGRGASRQAWRDHRDRVRDMARARQQQHEQNQEGGAGGGGGAEPPMARVVSSVPAQQAGEGEEEAAAVGVPVPLTPQQSEEMLDMALKLSLQDAPTTSTTSEAGEGGSSSDSNKGGAAAEKEVEEEDDDACCKSSSATSSATNSLIQEAVGLSAQQAAQRRLYNVRFVCDLTFPDGTVVQPRVELHKSWALLNTGTQPLPADTRLVFAYGNRMDGPEDGIHVGAVLPGQEFTVTVPLVAPAETRQHVSVWRLESRSAADEAGEAEPLRIGNRIWLDITVEDADLALSSEGWTFVTDHAVQHEEEEAVAAGGDEVVKEEAEETAAAAPVTTNIDMFRSALEVPPPEQEEEEEVAATPVPPQTGGSAPAPVQQQEEEAAAERDYGRWTEELEQLAEIGFTDFDRCVDVLEEKHEQGGMQAVIDALLGQ